MTLQSLKKIGQNLLKLESGNEALTDGRTLKIFGGYVAGYKKSILLSTINALNRVVK